MSKLSRRTVASLAGLAALLVFAAVALAGSSFKNGGVTVNNG